MTFSGAKVLQMWVIEVMFFWGEYVNDVGQWHDVSGLQTGSFDWMFFAGGNCDLSLSRLV